MFDDEQGGNDFFCKLERCTATSTSGTQCSRMVCVELPYCGQHLKTQKDVEVKHSPIQSRGLFAWVRGGGNGIIFRMGDPIIFYGGEVVTDIQTCQRYGNATATYMLRRNAHLSVDAACKRDAGISSMEARTVQKRDSLATSLVRATANIRNGSRIIAAYGQRYWKAAQNQHKTKR
jgi:hypothetical protein